MHFRSGGVDPGRDGCRVPLPWSGSRAPFGFSGGPTTASDDDGAQPWLPQPADWAELTVEAQDGDPDSFLSLYREALRLRREEPALHESQFAWLDVPGAADDVLAFTRGHGFACVVNLGPAPVAMPEHTDVLLTSDRLEGGLLPTDTAVWLRLPDGAHPNPQ